MIPAFKQLGSIKQLPALKNYMQNHMLSEIIFTFYWAEEKYIQNETIPVTHFLDS